MINKWSILIIACITCSCTSGIKGIDIANEYYNLGNAYYNKKDYNKASQFYKNAIAINPDYFKAKYNYALSLICLNDHVQANKVLEELLQEDPENIEILTTTGYSYFMDGQTDKALLIFERILKISPDSKNANYNMGIILWQMERKEEAISIFQKIVDQVPEDTDSLYNLSYLLYETKRYNESIENINKYIEKDKNYVDAYVLLSKSYSMLERYYLAIEAYNRALDIESGNKEVLFEKAVILLTEVMDADEGYKELNQAIDKGYNDKERLIWLYNSPDLVEKEKMKTLLEKKNIFPDEAHPAAQDEAQNELD